MRSGETAEIAEKREDGRKEEMNHRFGRTLESLCSSCPGGLASSEHHATSSQIMPARCLSPFCYLKAMIKRILRALFAIFAGIAVAMVFIVGVEAVQFAVWPFPAGADPHDVAACNAYCGSLPAAAFAMAVVGWGLAELSGSYVATRLGPGRHPAFGIGLGSVLFAGAVANMLMLPYPTWFCVANLVVLPAAFITGAKLARPRVRRSNEVIG